MNHLPLHVRVPIEGNNPSITRLEEKCIKCGMCNVQKLGMHVKVYDHTVSEMIGSIVNSNRTCSLHWHKLF